MINVTFVTFHYVIIYTEESVDVPQTCTFIEVTSNFLSPVRGYAGRERASLTSAPPFTKLLKIFSQGRLHFAVAFALCRKKFINVEFLIYCIKNTIVFYAVNRNSVHFVDFRSD